MKRVKLARNVVVALTGICGEPRFVLIEKIAKRGGIVSDDKGRVTFDTEILVRGVSSQWKHGLYGTKEEKAFDLIRDGSPLSIVLAEDLPRLLQGKAVREYPFVAGYEVDLLRVEGEAGRRKTSGSSAPTMPKGKLDKKTVVTSRQEQGFLRHHLFGSRPVAACSICGKELPTNVMVVAHIKSRSRCSAVERRDVNNVVMPLCQLGCDVLYERGYVTVSPEGKVVASKRGSVSPDLRGKLKALASRKCPAHTKTSEKYFAWHRSNAFL